MAPSSSSPVSTAPSTSSAPTAKLTSSTSTAKSFWPRELMFSASPHPSQLEGGRQMDVAPMCPCHDCWEYGSHAFAPPRRPKATKTPRASKASNSKPPKTTLFLNEKKSPLHFLKRLNGSKDSVASDMRPLRHPIGLASAANSVHSME
ncbi:hypothetical protein F503_06473 [Ophiostoma piceae UAMH 11346]|uniref:Uncharacterized protein n=1 Tax=Ophiostoma piceae (strain UAMH 11346) TaxID=1262450 RepID=S3BTJ8_OPHP1|nr:hypothetical protein F503_06473 [Ophiostoma piceae UAMH 11346]